MLLELQGVSKRYGATVAVDTVTLAIDKGEFFCLLGPSGCGKTTILRMIAGFEKPTTGRILLNGADITDLPPNLRDVNTVFQNYALFPNYNVRDNVAYGLRVRKRPEQEITERVGEALAMVGLEALADRLPDQLSGGQQQRVALARALVNRPALLLLDEPLSALDKKIAEQTRLELCELQRKVGIAFVFVTHNQTEALTLANRIAVMDRGLVAQCAPPAELYARPATAFVADFIGSMNFFDGVVTANSAAGTELRLFDAYPARYREATACAPGDAVRYGVRPEQLRISMLEPKEFENGLTGIIERLIFMGEATKFIIRLDNGQQVRVDVLNYLVIEEKPFGFELGERVFITWSRSSGVLLRD